MKKLLFFISSVAMAEMPQHWFSLDTPNSLYLSREACPGECYPVIKNGALIGDVSTLIVKDVTESICVDDLKKPNFSKQTEVEKCDDALSCRKILSDKKCEIGSAFIDGKFSQVYCSNFLGYDQICHDETSKKLVVDDAKKAAKDAKDAKDRSDADAKKSDQDARKKRIEDFDLNSANSVAQLKGFLKDLQDERKEQK